MEGNDKARGLWGGRDLSFKRGDVDLGSRVGKKSQKTVLLMGLHRPFLSTVNLFVTKRKVFKSRKWRF